ncbi:hypothetical protein GGX14DRAFT_333981, partial [Mycena pura]
RVLIIGRANAGKTSILQRVCHWQSTESPVIYRTSIDTPGSTSSRTSWSSQTTRAISIFHDSRGLANGSEEELRRVQDFVSSNKSQDEYLLSKRLHAIW